MSATASRSPLADRIVAGDIPALARGISLVENGAPEADALLAALHPAAGRARRVGITGPPGAGKSTVTAQLIQALRADGTTVGVVAVDPTSPFTGGALLGDRIRMDQAAIDPGVFVRSMATRGSLGGLALATGEAVDLVDAAGFEWVLIETVGVGQSELDVTTIAETTVLVLVPEAGDGVQTLKSGIMEAADLFLVNKADRPGADVLARELRVMLELRRRGSGTERTPWEPPILQGAMRSGTGVRELLASIGRHQEWLATSGAGDVRRAARREALGRSVLRRALERWAWGYADGERRLQAAREGLRSGAITPYALAASVVADLGPSAVSG